MLGTKYDTYIQQCCKLFDFYDILIWCLTLIHTIDLLMNFVVGPIYNSAWLYQKVSKTICASINVAGTKNIDFGLAEHAFTSVIPPHLFI